MSHTYMTEQEIQEAENRCYFSEDKPFSQAARSDLPRALADVRELRRVVGELLKAGMFALDEMCKASASRTQFTDAVDALDAALALARKVEGGK